MLSILLCCIFFFKQKTAYEMRISDWSSDVCSSDLARSSAQVPAPTIGESPTRPQRLPVTPPVEVAAATWPCASRATAPTVPYFMSTSNALPPDALDRKSVV